MCDPESRYVVSRRRRCSIECALLNLCSISVRVGRKKAPTGTLGPPPLLPARSMLSTVEVSGSHRGASFSWYHEICALRKVAAVHRLGSRGLVGWFVCTSRTVFAGRRRELEV